MAGKAHVKSANTLCKNKCIVPTLQILNSVYAACVNTFYDLKSHFSVECGIWYLIHSILRISNFYRSIDDIFVRISMLPIPTVILNIFRGCDSFYLGQGTC